MPLCFLNRANKAGVLMHCCDATRTKLERRVLVSVLEQARRAGKSVSHSPLPAGVALPRPWPPPHTHPTAGPCV